MMIRSMKYRSNEIEIMDDLEMEGEVLIDALDKLGHINKWLGGNRLTVQGVLQVLKGRDKNKVYTIIDLGCGHGDLLRVLADAGKKNGYQFELIGVDANQATIDYANELSTSYSNVKFLAKDIFDTELDQLEYDIALSTLFLHHFEEEEILGLIKRWTKSAKLAVIVNDLHRHPMAYFLFNILSTFFGNHMTRNDGLLSIRKGFKKAELQSIANQFNFKSSILWKWAFRYEWIIQIK